MKKITATTLLLGLLAGTGVETKAQSPKIVVGIVVDQLRTDYIEQLRPYFGEGGFNRLIREGVYLQDVDFRGTSTDAATGAAIVYTGAWPVANGVAGAMKLDSARKQYVPVLSSDASRLKTEYTPENLKLSTLSDELFINQGPLSRIYSVAGDPQVAVIGAGHAGNSAVWFDESTGKWATPAFYGTLPPVISNKNRTSPLSIKIASSVWRPLYPASHYPQGKVWNDGDFTYGFSGSNRDAYSRFKESAPFNAVVTDAAIDILKTIKSANSDRADMVSIEYTLAPISFDYGTDSRPELIDSYMRLDSEIGRLIDAIYTDFGKDNVLVFLSSTGYAQEPAISETAAKLPSGEITLKKAESLLNSYLSAQYGNADYVSLIKDGKVYLDHKSAEGKGVDITRLREVAKSFFLKMGGISEAFTIDEILRGGNRKYQDMALGIDPKNSPDILLNFAPGWLVTDDNVYPEVTEKIRMASPATPAFILSPGVEAQTVTYPVEATVLAPTISSLLRIRAPNGAADKPIVLSEKYTTTR